MSRRMRSILLAAVALIAGVCGAGAVEQVDISQNDPALHDTALHSVLFRPQGQGPFPAVVALHGCESLFNRSGKLAARFADWGERLAAAGLVAIFPDSFGSRGLRAQCRVKERKVRPERERVADANAARRWLEGQSWVIK